MSSSIFTTQTPTLADLTDGVPYTLATLFTSAEDALVNGIRWYFPGTLPSGNVVGVLYSWTTDVAGAEMARATFASPTAGTWNTVTFTSPVAITASTRYVAAVYTPDRYVATIGLLNAPITNGRLTAPANDNITPAHNGKFRSGGVGPTYPDGSGNGSSYFVDVDVTFASEVVSTPGNFALTTAAGSASQATAAPSATQATRSPEGTLTTAGGGR